MYWIERADRNTPLQLDQGVPPAYTPAETIDFRDYWRPIRDHLRLIIVIFSIAEFMTLAFLTTRTRVYTSTSTILIEREAPEILEPKRFNEEGESGAETFYATQYELLKSRSLAARVISDH